MKNLLKFFHEELHIHNSCQFCTLPAMLRLRLLTEMLENAADDRSIEEVLNFDVLDLRMILVKRKPRLTNKTNIFGLIVGKFTTRQDDFLVFLPKEFNFIEEPLYSQGTFDYICKKILEISDRFSFQSLEEQSKVYAGFPMN